MAENGRLPAGSLADIPGGRLTREAAASWNRMRRAIGEKTGVWICPTSTRTAYRPYADQVYFWNLYQAGKGSLAARPGTSNHGWGLAVDVPQPKMARLINQYGAEYGWQKRWSDAPSEWWHFKYAPQHDRHRGEHSAPKRHPYHVLTDTEKQARNTLVKERRIAKRHGGWGKVDPGHLERAKAAKATLSKQMRQIREAIKTDGGWTKANRRVRYDYMHRLVNG